jgi:hypothetical protein
MICESSEISPGQSIFQKPKDRVWSAIAALLQAFTPAQCASYDRPDDIEAGTRVRHLQLELLDLRFGNPSPIPSGLTTLQRALRAVERQTTGTSLSGRGAYFPLTME